MQTHDEKALAAVKAPMAFLLFFGIFMAGIMMFDGTDTWPELIIRFLITFIGFAGSGYWFSKILTR